MNRVLSGSGTITSANKFKFFLLDDGPVVIHPQLKFWEWVSDYYLSSIGDVMRAALPAGLKVESERVLSGSGTITSANKFKFFYLRKI